MRTISKILRSIFRASNTAKTAGQLGSRCLNLLQKGNPKLEKCTAIALCTHMCERGCMRIIYVLPGYVNRYTLRLLETGS